MNMTPIPGTYLAQLLLVLTHSLMAIPNNNNEVKWAPGMYVCLYILSRGADEVHNLLVVREVQRVPAHPFLARESLRGGGSEIDMWLQDL